MHHQPSINALDLYHRPILTTLASGRTELKKMGACSVKVLALIRWDLMRHLRAYQIYKHVRVFDPLIASGSARQAATAANLKGRCLALSADYEDHVKRWSFNGPASAWDRYVSEALIMLARIEGHIAFERQKIGELLIMA